MDRRYFSCGILADLVGVWRRKICWLGRERTAVRFGSPPLGKMEICPVPLFWDVVRLRFVPFPVWCLSCPLVRFTLWTVCQRSQGEQAKKKFFLQRRTFEHFRRNYKACFVAQGKTAVTNNRTSKHKAQRTLTTEQAKKTL